MSRAKKSELPTERIDEFERDVIEAACMLQVERYWEQQGRADRWRKIANAVRLGHPIVYSAKAE